MSQIKLTRGETTPADIKLTRLDYLQRVDGTYVLRTDSAHVVLAETDNASTSVDGVAGTGSAGTVTVAAKATANPTGVAGTGAADTPTVSGKANVTVTGVAGTGAAGTPTVSGKATVPVTDVSGTGAAGDLTVSGKANTTVTGVAGTGSAGDLTISGKAAVAPTGVAGTGAAGDPTISAKAVVPVTGVSSTGTAGTPTVSGKAIVSPTGVAGTGSVGTLTGSGGSVAVSAALTGVSGTGSVGALSVSGKATTTISGVSGTGQIGTLAGVGDVFGTLAATDVRDTTSLPGRVNITFIASAVPGGNPTTTFNVTIPTVASGDLLLLACTNRDATAAPTVVDTDTGGNTWTRKTSATSKGSLWWKRATSTTSGKVITASGFTGSSSGVLVVLRGCAATGDPFNTYSLEDNISGNEIHTGFTPYESGTWVGLAVHNVGNDNAVTLSSTTSPGSLTQGAESLSTGGSDCATSLMGLLQPTAVPTGNITWAQTNGVTVSQAFAVKPYQPTGTLVVTDAADSASVSGSINSAAASGGFALTEGADTAVLAGAVLVSGSFAATEASDTVSFLAQVLGYDAVLRTDNFYILRAGGGRSQRTSAPVAVSGSLTVTGATDASDLAGLLSAAGGLSGEDGHDTAVLAGTVGIAGTVGAVEAADVSGTSITVADPISVNSAELRTDNTYIWRTDGAHVLRAAAIQISAGSPAELRTDNAYILRSDGTHVLRSEAVATAGSSELRTDNAFILRSDGTHVLRAETLSTSTELRTDNAHILRTDGSLMLRASDAAVAGVTGTLAANETADDVSLSAAALFTPTLSWATGATDSTPDFLITWQSQFLNTSLPVPVLTQVTNADDYLPSFDLSWAGLADGDIVAFEYAPESQFLAFNRAADIIGVAELAVGQSTLQFPPLGAGTYYGRARVQRAGAVSNWSSTVVFVVATTGFPAPTFPYTEENFLDGDTVVVQYAPDSVFSSYTELTDVITTSEVASNQTTLGGTALAPGSYYVRARIVQLGATTDWSNTVLITITDQITGSLAALENEDIGRVFVDIASQGGLGPAEAKDSANVLGTVAAGDVLGALAATDTADVVAVDGTVATEGSFGLSEAFDTIAIAGLLGAFGTLAATEAPEAVSLTGDLVVPPYELNFALTEATDSAIFAGGIYATGTFDLTEATDTASLAGEVGIVGTIDAVEATDAVSLVGELPDVITGPLAVTEVIDNLGLDGALGGFVEANGGFSLTEGQDTLSVNGFIPCVGTINGVEASDVSNINGRPEIVATGGGGAWLGDYYDQLGKADRKRKAEKRAIDKRIRQTIARIYNEIKGIVEDAPEGLQDEFQAEVAAIIQPAMLAPIVELPQASYIDFGLLADRTQNIEAILAQMLEEIRLRIEDEEEDDDLLLFA